MLDASTRSARAARENTYASASDALKMNGDTSIVYGSGSAFTTNSANVNYGGFDQDNSVMYSQLAPSAVNYSQIDPAAPPAYGGAAFVGDSTEGQPNEAQQTVPPVPHGLLL